MHLPSPLRHNIFRQTRAPFGPHSDEDLRWRPGAPQACHFASVIGNNLWIGNPQAASSSSLLARTAMSKTLDFGSSSVVVSAGNVARS